MNRRLYYGLGILVCLLLIGGVYLLAVPYTEILISKEALLRTRDTFKAPYRLNFTTQVVFHTLEIVGQIGVLVGLLLLTLRTKSKGYLFFKGKGIGKLASILMIVYLKQNVGTLLL